MFALVLTLVLLQPQAPGRGVTVSGTVQDQTGAVLPGAHVALAVADGAVPIAEKTTDASGAFRFDQIAAGTYELRVDFPGFRSKATRIRVTTRPASAGTLVLEIEGLTQQVDVSGGAAAARPDAAANLNAITVDASTLDDLPVLDQDVVGTMSRFLDATAIGTNGASIIVDGVEVNALLLSASAVQQIKINQDPYSAEFMRPGRGRIEIVTKPGGRDYSGTLNVRFRDSALAAKNAFAAEKAPEQRRIVEGTLGGPLPGTRTTSFLLSGSFDSEANQAVVFAATPLGIVQANVSTPYSNLLLGGTITHQHGQKHTVSLRLSHLDQNNTNQGVGGVVLPEAGYNHEDREDEVTFSDQMVVSNRLLHETRLLFGVEHEPRVSVTPNPRIVVLDAFTGGGAQNDQLRTEHHFTLLDAFTWSPAAHVLRFGINIPDWSWRGNNDRTNSAGTFTFSSLQDFTAGRPFSFVQQIGNGQTAFLEKVVGLFIRDEIHVRPNLSVDLGLRYDWQNYFHDDNNFAPRVSFAYAPGHENRTIIRGGAGVFYDRTGPGPIQDLLRYDGNHLLRVVLTDPGFPSPLPPGETALSQPPSLVRLAPDVTIPFTVQYSAGLERQLRPRTTLAVNFVGTRGVSVFRSRDINAPPPPDYLERPDANDAVVRQIESAGVRRSASIEVTLYSENRASDNTSGIYWMPPNAYDLSREYGPSDFERRHVLELFGTYTPAAWLNVGVSFEAYSGRPYSLITGSDDFNTGTANARPPGVGRNSLRGPDFASLDLRWWREFAVNGASGKKRSIAFGVDAFNVLNRTNAAYYVGTLSSPFFGHAISALAPRRLQLSLRARY